MGESQRFFGMKINSIGTPRLSLEHWLQVLSPTYGELNDKEILISALRNRTWIEWAVYCACTLRQWGYSSTLLYRKSEIDTFYTNPIDYFNFWNKVKEIPNITLLDIESYPIDAQYYGQEIEGLTHILNEGVAYDNRIEPIDIIENTQVYQAQIDELKIKINQTAAVLNTIFSQTKFHRVICYSGIIADTPAILKTALKYNILTITVEGWWRPGQLIYNVNRPALEFNIKGWFDILNKNWSEKENKEIDEYMAFLEGKKIVKKDWLSDFYLVQKSAVDDELEPAIKEFLKDDGRSLFLLSPNVIGDSATINRISPFKGQKDWIEQNIIFFKENPQYKLIIRAHPAETWMASKVKIKLGEFAHEKAQGISNILVIPASNKTNTFSIIPKIECGLVWVSTVGVDMVIKGKNIINAANPKYSGIGFNYEPKTINDYFSAIHKFAQGSNKPTPKMIELAKKYHYMVYRKIGFIAYGKDFKSQNSHISKLKIRKEHNDFYNLLVDKSKMIEI